MFFSDYKINMCSSKKKEKKTENVASAEEYKEESKVILNSH